MAIDFGKGIRGFLGRVPTINYQYTPIPFREMLAAGQLATQQENNNLKLMGQVNQLYNKPLLPRDREIFDEKDTVKILRIKMIQIFMSPAANMRSKSRDTMKATIIWPTISYDSV